GSIDKTVRVWDAERGKELASLTGHESMLRSVLLSPDGMTLATSADDGTVRLYEFDAVLAGEKQPRAVRRGHNAAGLGLAFSPDGKLLAAGTGSWQKQVQGEMTLWNVATGNQVEKVTNFGNSVACLAFSPDGKRLVAALSDGTVRVMDAKTRK